MIGLVAVTAAGRAAADRLAAAWPGETRHYDGPAAQVIPRAWAECRGLVCFLAVGATVRVIVPLLASKRSDPAVVCVDEAARHAVALVGGHAAGANELAARVAAVLGAEPVVTTATDSAGLPGLDDLGWPAEGALAAVSRALLDREPVTLEADVTWPIPAIPLSGESGGACPGGRPPGARRGARRFEVTPSLVARTSLLSPGVTAPRQVNRYQIVITDRIVPVGERTVVLRPPSLVVGVGASRGVSAAEVAALIDGALASAGLAAGSVTAVATVEAKAAEAGIVAAARDRGWPVITHPADALALVPVPNPSQAALAAVGTPSVAEAAALASADALIVPKRKSAMATVAVARRRPRGRLALIGLGPGARDLLTPRAVAELRRSSVIVGLDQYVDQVTDLLRPGTRVLASGLGAEEVRARTAVQQACQGHAVALVGSGDAGVYAMASPALSLAGEDIDVLAVPGVTAGLAAAALVGAPLGHDHAVISLSDLHTPWAAIERRVAAAAAADFVVVFYNPRSRGRDWQLGAALEILRRHRARETPAAVVRDADRPGQQVSLGTLAGLDPAGVDMRCVVIVGSASTRTIAGRMVTPRGYRWL